MAWDVVFTVLGATIVVYGLSDIFLTLVHPHARGRLTRAIVAGIWRLLPASGGVRARHPGPRGHQRRAHMGCHSGDRLGADLPSSCARWVLVLRGHRPGCIRMRSRRCTSLWCRCRPWVRRGRAHRPGRPPTFAYTGGDRIRAADRRSHLASSALPDARPQAFDRAVPDAAGSGPLRRSSFARSICAPQPQFCTRRGTDRECSGRPESEPGVVLLSRGRGSRFPGARVAGRPGARRRRSPVAALGLASAGWCSTRRWRISADACATTSGPRGESRADVMASFARDHS